MHSKRSIFCIGVLVLFKLAVYSWCTAVWLLNNTPRLKYNAVVKRTRCSLRVTLSVFNRAIFGGTTVLSVYMRFTVDRVRVWKLRVVVTRFFPERFFDAGCEYRECFSSHHYPLFLEKAPRSIRQTKALPCDDVSANTVCTINTWYYILFSALRRLPPPDAVPQESARTWLDCLFWPPLRKKRPRSRKYGKKQGPRECNTMSYRSTRRTTLEQLTLIAALPFSSSSFLPFVSHSL